MGVTTHRQLRQIETHGRTDLIAIAFGMGYFCGSCTGYVLDQAIGHDC